jgi:hypothetical protein
MEEKPKKRTVGKIKFDAAYAVAEYLTVKRIRKRLDMIKQLKIRSKEPSDPYGAITGLFSGTESGNTDVIENYWDKSMTDTFGMGERAFRAALSIQVVIRGYLYLKRLREAWDVGTTGLDRTLLIQSAVTRWRFRMNTVELARKKISIEKKFHLFCVRMYEEGFNLRMFSKKYGTAADRKVYFDDEMTEFVYDVGKFSTKRIPLNEIYQVQKGLSGYPYDVQPIRKAYCFHFVRLGGRRYDFECSSLDECNEFVSNFHRMILLVYTAAPFYVDKHGIPRRAGPSVIKYALQKSFVGPKGSRSEADLLRFRDAVSSLRTEYDDWQRHYEQEREVRIACVGRRFVRYHLQHQLYRDSCCIFHVISITSQI